MHEDDLSEDSEGNNAILEIDNEEEYEEDAEVDQKIDMLKTKLREKTFKINDLN